MAPVTAAVFLGSIGDPAAYDSSKQVLRVAGLTLVEAVEILHRKEENAKHRDVLNDLLIKLRQGTKFWDQDRMMAPEIEAAKRVALDPALREVVALSALA